MPSHRNAGLRNRSTDTLLSIVSIANWLIDHSWSEGGCGAILLELSKIDHTEQQKVK